MNFLYPLGLLGLIGIPILIIIYIIKSKYTEQTVASTYMWTLSERFLKRKRKVSKLSGLISLLLQLLAVTLISLAIAHPIITVPNAADEYFFILDGSGSMNMTVDGKADGKTRFECAKDAVSDAIDKATDGSIFTLVYVGDTTGVVFSKTDDKEEAYILLEELTVSQSRADLSRAFSAAQEYFNENPSLLTYLVTDADYEATQNVEVINVATETVENYSLFDISYNYLDEKLKVTGQVTSYVSDASLTLELYLNDESTPSETLSVSVKGGESSPISIEAYAPYFAKAALKIREDDALMSDNEHMLYNIKSEDSYKTLVVSDRPVFLKTALESQLNATIDVIPLKDYADQRGYGLYIFDSADAATLSQLPQDGSVWLINMSGYAQGSGYTFKSEITLKKDELLKKTVSTSSLSEMLTEDMRWDDIYIKRYYKCSYYSNFTTVMTCQDNPVVFAGINENGNRQVVFTFDLHDSGLPLTYDYMVLVRNLLRYSFPDMVEDTSFLCGELAEINVIPNCTSIRVESPSGAVSYLNTDRDFDRVKLTEIGTYTVKMTVSDSVRSFNIWSAVNEYERQPHPREAAVSLQGESTEGGFDGFFDPMTIIFIALAVVFTADWMVYCYEKYQLR